MYGNYGSGSRGGGFRPRGGDGGFAPVKVGEELEVTIEAVGEKGDGIAKKNGFVIFVPGVKEGQKVRIRITKVLRKVGFAEVAGAGTAAPAAEGEAPAETAEAPAEGEAPAEASTEDSESFGEEAAESEGSEETY
jgi:predicted RNA-binding protein with TRAM domain